MLAPTCQPLISLFVSPELSLSLSLSLLSSPLPLLLLRTSGQLQARPAGARRNGHHAQASPPLELSMPPQHAGATRCPASAPAPERRAPPAACRSARPHLFLLLHAPACLAAPPAIPSRSAPTHRRTRCRHTPCTRPCAAAPGSAAGYRATGPQAPAAAGPAACAAGPLCATGAAPAGHRRAGPPLHSQATADCRCACHLSYPIEWTPPAPMPA